MVGGQSRWRGQAAWGKIRRARETARAMTMAPPAIDLDRIFKLRLVVGRYGEMDVAKWWNTKGVLGKHGASVFQRGFPTTHHFAQARVVFAVARTRCAERFPAPAGCMTLWNLPAELEDAFEERWQVWLDDVSAWKPFFEALVPIQPQADLAALLAERGLLTPDQVATTAKLRRSAEGRAVALPAAAQPTDDLLALLAGGFARGEPGNPAVPYAPVLG